MLRGRLTRFHLVVFSSLAAGLAICIWSGGAWRWGLLSFTATATGLAIGLGVSFPQLQLFGWSLCRVSTTRRAVALTFDDGPDPEVTPSVLESLARHRLRATFFCVGAKVRRHPELAQRIAAEGHQVENHSFAHSFLTNLFSVRRLREDVAAAQREISRTTGVTPRFFRPPVGLTNLRVFRVARELGLQVTGYSARGLDRRPDPTDRIICRLLKGVKPGGILLLHDSGVQGAKTAELVASLARHLAASGFECVRLDELVDANALSTTTPSYATPPFPPTGLGEKPPLPSPSSSSKVTS